MIHNTNMNTGMRLSLSAIIISIMYTKLIKEKNSNRSGFKIIKKKRKPQKKFRKRIFNRCIFEFSTENPYVDTIMILCMQEINNKTKPIIPISLNNFLYFGESFLSGIIITIPSKILDMKIKKQNPSLDIRLFSKQT